MIAEKTIEICGKLVTMRYCAAAETGYETLSGQSSDIFVPDIERDEDGNITNIIQKAKADDYIRLAIAAMVAAYEFRSTPEHPVEPPVTSKDIMFSAEPNEVTEMITTVIELRNKWYQVPNVVKPEFEEDDDANRKGKRKNAKPPTTSSRK